MKKSFLSFSLLIFCCSLLPLYSGGKKEKSLLPEKVVIGYQAIPNGEIIAKDLSFVEDALRVPIEWVQINSGSELNIGLAAGSIDFGLSGSSGIAAGIAISVPFEVIWIQDIIGDNEGLVVNKDSNIKSMNDLIGKKIAVPFGATTHYHLLAAMKLEGIDPELVEILDMQPPDALAAWIRGDIDGSFIWEPTLAKMIENNGEVLVYSRKLAEAGYLTGDITVVRSDFAKEYPELVSLYLKAQVKAVELYKNDEENSAMAVSRQFNISLAEAKRQMKSLVLLSGQEQLSSLYLGKDGEIGDLPAVLKATADFLATQKTIKSSPDLKVFQKAIHPEYLQMAME